MLALTLIRPWSDALSLGPKPIENRSWPPPRSALGQLVAFHGGKKWDEDASLDMRTFYEHPALWPECPRTSAESPMGVVGYGLLLGYIAPDGVVHCPAEVRDVALRIESANARWYNPGSYGWIFDERRPLHAPVHCRGAQGLWRLPDEVERLVREQIGGAT